MSKIWKELQFIREIVIKAEDPGKPVHVEFKEDDEYEQYYDSDFTYRAALTKRERSISLLGNAMYEVRCDYPEDFKKLVAATGDCGEAYRLYKALQKKVPDNWADYDEGNVW